MGAAASPLEVEEIIARITAEAARRRAVRGHAGVELFPMKRKYALGEFLRLDSEEFVRAAYRGLLRRDPKPDELATDLSRLGSGRFAKADLLIRLRWSAEGRAFDVKISGLKRLRRIRRIQHVPLLGSVVTWIVDRERPMPGHTVPPNRKA